MDFQGVGMLQVSHPTMHLPHIGCMHLKYLTMFYHTLAMHQMQYQDCNLVFGMYEHPISMFSNRLASYHSHPKWHYRNHHVYSEIESQLNKINVLVNLTNHVYKNLGIHELHICATMLWQISRFNEQGTTRNSKFELWVGYLNNS